jgi:diguanylate cyclase (GGDEF)-like protein
VSAVNDASTIIKLLEKSPLFQDIPHKILAPIFKESMQISLTKGEQLLTPGIINEHVYIIISGQLSVHLTMANMDEPLAVLNPGECVGEMSVLVDSKVSAFVVAKTDCQLLAVGYSAFWSLIKGSNESARNMLDILVQRIRLGNEVIADTLLHHEKSPDKIASVDSLTGLYNHHGIQDKFDRMLQICTANKQPLCLILLKVDEVTGMFSSDKLLNDELPIHPIAQTILAILRPGDHAARLNGKKFALLLANLPLSDACATAERLRATICQNPIRLPDGGSLPPVTVSAGVCKANEDDTWSTLRIKTNQALDRAIDAGCNRISD